MRRTRKPGYGPSDPRFRDSLPDLRLRQSWANRTARGLLSRGVARKQLCGIPRTHPHGLSTGFTADHPSRQFLRIIGQLMQGNPFSPLRY